MADYWLILAGHARKHARAKPVKEEDAVSIDELDRMRELFGTGRAFGE